MQFKIDDQEYFLSFVENERRWYVFAPTANGMRRMPVYVDAGKYERFGLAEAGTHKTQN